MKTILLSLTLGFVALGLGGCSRGEAASEAPHQEHEVVACTYKEGVGLELSKVGAEFLGLRTAEFGGQLPASALLRTIKGDFVYVANGGRYLRTPVKVTAASGGYVVDDGLYEGDVIVVSGVQGLWLAEIQAVNGGVGCADEH